jgi:hypothetical protein
MQNEEDSKTNNTDDKQVQFGCALHSIQVQAFKAPLILKTVRPFDNSDCGFLLFHGIGNFIREPKRLRMPILPRGTDLPV